MTHISEDVIKWWIRWTQIYSGKTIDQKEAIIEIEAFKKVIKGLKTYHD